jgi:ERCC3/RAD25/XPB C-terminal helicase
MLTVFVYIFISQGYTFKIVTNLCDRAAAEAVKDNYRYKSADDDREMLRTVLSAETDLEKEQRQEDNAIRKNNEDGAKMADEGTRRTGGIRMDQISGGSAARYKEISSTKRHPLFRKRKR